MPVRRTVTTRDEIMPSGPAPEDQPGSTPGDVDLWDYMRSLPETEWQKTTIYLYQIEPSVTRKEGEPAYLKKFGGPFDEDAVRQIAPQGTRFKAIAKRVGEAPTNFFFAMVPQPGVAAQPAAAQSSNELVPLLKELIAKAQSGNTEEMLATFRQAKEIMNTTYTESLKTVAAQKGDPEGQLLDKLVKLGLIGGRGGEGGGLLETITALKSLGLIDTERKSPLDQLLELKDVARTFFGGGGSGDDDDWKKILARSAPDWMGHLEGMTRNIAQALAGVRAPQGQQPPRPTAAQIEEAGPPAQPQPPQQPAQDVMQNAMDTLIKAKLVEFHHNEIPADEIVDWLALTSPEMVDDLQKYESGQIMAYFQSDPVLRQIGSGPEVKAWIEAVLKEMKESQVEA